MAEIKMAVLIVRTTMVTITKYYIKKQQSEYGLPSGWTKLTSTLRDVTYRISGCTNWGHTGVASPGTVSIDSDCSIPKS